MRKHARAVVIGGGVVGVSTLYHLAKKGWTDSVLVERAVLGSGSTWHAAGLISLFNMSCSALPIHKRSVALYKTLEEETGLDTGIRVVSNIRLAHSADRMDEYRQYASVAETAGVRVEFLTPGELREIWPLCETDGMVGAIRNPEDGYIQPADLTSALAKGARNLGAEIRTRTRVTAIRREKGEWVVVTDKGSIRCEHVVSATGCFVRKTGEMVGLDIPVVPVQHQYIVTEDIPGLAGRREQGLPELPVLRHSDGSWYMRQERDGLLLGPYELGAPACHLDGPADDSEHELFDGDIDRMGPHIESAIRTVPAFGEAGVRKVYNGAICFTPDGSPIVGPAWDLPNFWLNEGHSFGVTAGGGSGWQIAEWIVEGEPGIDMLALDPRRFGDYATRTYVIAKAEEAYLNVFTVHYPDEERPAARPLRTSPCHDRLRELGAVFGQRFGWERANWFAPAGVPREDHWSFRRSRWFAHVGEECRNVHENVGVLDATPFAKCRVSGPGAERFLDGLVANRLPAKAGQVRLCHALNTRGGVHSEFTILREAGDSFYLVSAAGLQRLDHDWIRRHMPADGSVTYADITGRRGVLVVAGPRSRELMRRVSPRSDFSDEGHPWLTGKWADVGICPALAVRMSFVGELGWELHHPVECQNGIFDELMRAGEDLGIRPFGVRAMDSLRIEKSHKVAGQDLSVEYAAYESGLRRFVRPDKGGFVGRDALLERERRGFAHKGVTLEVHDVEDADPLGGNPVLRGGKPVGRATSGNFGFRVGKSLALAMVDPAAAGAGAALEIDVLGKRLPATVIEDSPFDPGNGRPRGAGRPAGAVPRVG